MTRASRLAPLPALALGFATLAAQAAVAPVALERLFPREAEIFVEEPGLQRLILPAEVLAACRPDLSDLRIFDARDREVAFLVDSQRHADGVELRETFEAPILELRRDEQEPELGPSLFREVYTIGAPPTAPEVSADAGWELVVEVPRARFVREVTITRASGAREGETLARSEPFFRLDAETQRTRFALRGVSGGTLRVAIEGREEGYLEPRFRFETARMFDPLQRSVVPLEEIARESRDGVTTIELARPSGLVPDVVRLETSTGSFGRNVGVLDEQPGRADQKLGAGKVYRVMALRPVDHLEVRVRAATGATLRIEIQDGDSPPLADLRVVAVVRRPAVVFELAPGPQGAAAGTLRFGGGRARAPRYDLTSLALGRRGSLSGDPARAAARLYDPAELPLARLGAVRPNPAFDATPALAFAMHPGAEIDARLFSHRRGIALEPSAEGLSRVRLAPEDAATAREDAGDLRVVDAASRQWPYLLQRDAHRQQVALAVAPVDSRPRNSVYELALPVAPLHADRLTLHSEAPYFDRAYTLWAEVEGEDEVQLARGRLVKRARAPRPSRISFSPQRIVALRLEVEDGDDAPLSFHRAQARVRLPEIFLVAPGGHYQLLLGNPDVGAPRYELERVRDVVLAVSSSPATPGELEANPAFSMAARLRSSEGGLFRTAVVWGVLILAVVVLGALTLRVVRHESPPASGESET